MREKIDAFIKEWERTSKNGMWLDGPLHKRIRDPLIDGIAKLFAHEVAARTAVSGGSGGSVASVGGSAGSTNKPMIAASGGAAGKAAASASNLNPKKKARST